MSENGTNMNAVSTEQINDDTFLSANEYLQRSSQSNSGSVGGGRKRRIIIDKYHDEAINFKTAKRNKNSNFTSNLRGELLGDPEKLLHRRKARALGINDVRKQGAPFLLICQS